MTDVGAATGPDAPEPFRLFVVKVHSRCNLSCAYCYVYHHVDDGWRDQPTTMSRATMSHLARRIGDHVRAHRIPSIRVILHGGEPLLAGPDRIGVLATLVRAAVPASTGVDFAIQTNGLLLDDRFLDLFHQHHIRVGVSLDGGRAAHDRSRRFADGRGSYDLVCRALSTLARTEHRDIYAGILCTVDLASAPVPVYEELLAFAPPELDLLLPHGNWVHRPPGRVPDTGQVPYADWLIAVFDRWYRAPRRETGVRLFESLILLLLGGRSGTEALGVEAAAAVTVETDGTLEGTDALKTTAPRMAVTGLNVRENSFDQAAAHPVLRAQRGALDTLSAACRACPVVGVCGGGLYAHRWDTDGGFVNPSVYCPDLYRLIGHVRRQVSADLVARSARRGVAAPERSG